MPVRDRAPATRRHQHQAGSRPFARGRSVVMRFRRAFAFVVCSVIVMGGCGGPDYDAEFDAIVPDSWTEISSNGERERSYATNTATGTAQADLARQLAA